MCRLLSRAPGMYPDKKGTSRLAFAKHLLYTQCFTYISSILTHLCPPVPMVPKALEHRCERKVSLGASLAFWP